VLITSPGPGSGKTTVALHTAAAAAAGLGSKVILVEGDLRRPQLASRLRLPDDHGLTTLLPGNGAGDPRAIQSIDLGESALDTNGQNGAAHHALSVLPAGPRPTNAVGVLESEQMRALMRSWRSSYELTVVDSPPPGFVADTIPLAKGVDAVIVVAALGKDTGPGIRRLRVELERLGVEPIGVVANFGRKVKNPYASRQR
jgi:Mrp family chromosome partitioning ATPase